MRITVNLDGIGYNVYVNVRHGVTEFLDKMAEVYEIVIFTASLAAYANPLLDKLDVNKRIRGRLFRESCVSINGSYVKDLSKLGRNLKNVIIIDNSPMSYSL